MSKRANGSVKPRDVIVEAIRTLRDKSPQCEAYHPDVIRGAIPASMQREIEKVYTYEQRGDTTTRSFRDGDELVEEKRTTLEKKERRYPADISAICAAAARDGILRRVRVFLPKAERGPQTTVNLYDLAEPRTRLQKALAEAWRNPIGSRCYGYGGLPKHIREQVAAEVAAQEAAEAEAGITHVTIEGLMSPSGVWPANGYLVIKNGRVAGSITEPAPEPKKRKTLR